MNHKHYLRDGTLATTNYCHPEQPLAVSEAGRQMPSKDPYHLDSIRIVAGNFRVIVRFFDDHETECVSSREAPTERGERKSMPDRSA